MEITEVELTKEEKAFQEKVERHLELIRSDPEHYRHIMYAGGLNEKIKTLINDMKTTEEKCLSEDEKRIKQQAGIEGFRFISSTGTTFKIKYLNYNKDGEGKLEAEFIDGIDCNSLSQGKITLKKHPKNTRGNSANIEAMLGAAITCMKRAEHHLEKKEYHFLIPTLMQASEFYGAASGRFRSKAISPEVKEIRNDEILKEAKDILKIKPALKNSPTADLIIKKLGYSKKEKRNIRRIIAPLFKSLK